MEITKKGESPTIRNYLSPLEKAKVGEYFDKVIVTPKSITFGDHQKISLNVQPGMENDIKLLISQMIIRGMSHYMQNSLIKDLRRKIGEKTTEGINGTIDLYEAGSNGSGYDIDSNEGIILDTTIVRGSTLAKLFVFSKGKSVSAYEAEEKVVAELISNMVNSIVKSELDKEVKK